MSSLQLYLPASISGVAYVAACLAAVAFVVRFSRRSKFDAIPDVGPGGWFGHLSTAFRFLTADGTGIIQEGYRRYHPAPFKVADRYTWMVVVSDRRQIEELRRAPDDELSFVESVNNQLNTRHTLGDSVHDFPHHVMAVRSQLTRNLEEIYPDIRDEIVIALEEVLGLEGDGWKGKPGLGAMQNVISRTFNRVFLGLQLCRNPDWIDLSIKNTFNIMMTGVLLGLLPKFIRPLASYFLTAVAQDIAHSKKFLGPIIEERLRHLDEGDWAEKPNDFLTWLIEEAKGPHLTLEHLTSAILMNNIASLHTTTTSFTHVLLYLAANPQYVQPLREEVEAIVSQDGWSKVSVAKMRKVDSFLRECQRMEGLGSLSLARKALKDFTFSDGTFIPKGTVVCTATHCIHHNEALYENADVFEPFRFADMHDGDEEEGGKHHFVSTSTEYLPFGHGKHACPGRFFAAVVMKTLLAHMVTTYDVKLEDGTTRPPSLHVGAAILPDPRAKVLFRKRAD